MWYPVTSALVLSVTTATIPEEGGGIGVANKKKSCPELAALLLLSSRSLPKRRPDAASLCTAETQATCKILKLVDRTDMLHARFLNFCTGKTCHMQDS